MSIIILNWFHLDNNIKAGAHFSIQISTYTNYPQKTMIKPLTQEVAQDLCAQQVITNICDCIKQLVDNSIDAKATKIEIYLQQYGKKSIQVSDNGCGIESFQFLAKKGSTSKNRGNYQEVNTLGFRGEALHSLGKVSQKMNIISTFEGEKKKTVKFDVKTQKQQILYPTREHGTIVEIQSLFEYLPVRRYELLNKFKQFLKKTDEMIKQYCLIYPQIGFILKNNREGKEDLIIETYIHSISSRGGEDSSSKQWLERVQQVLGSKISQSLIYMKTQSLRGWILKNIESGSSKENNHIRRNMHYMYLNNRPIDPLPKIVNTLDLYYKKYNRSTKYVFILNILLPWNSYDVNLTPNKREILIKQTLTNKIIEELKQFVQKNVIEDIPMLQDYEEKQKQKEKMSNFLKNNKKQGENSQKIHNEIEQMKEQKEQYKHNQNKTVLQEQEKKIERKETFSLKSDSKQKVSLDQRTKDMGKSKLIESLRERMSIGSKRNLTPSLANKRNPQENVKIQQGRLIQKNHTNHQQNKYCPHTNIEFKKKIDREKIIEQENQQESKVIQFQNKLKQNVELNIQNQYHKSIKISKQIQMPNLPKNDLQILPQKTKHSLPKSAFKQFKILGQFNHGFIVCYYDQKYYLVDQHAASEKYHFERIMKSLKNKSKIYQKLLLNPIELENIQEHRNVLQRDGFKFEILEGETGVFLKQVPIFLEKIYGKEYFLQLASSKRELSEHSDFYMAAATKACRTAVMVGDVLQFSQMKNIVEQLSSLNSPWNCPHGRPTLIYLNSKSQIENFIGHKQRQYSLEL